MTEVLSTTGSQVVIGLAASYVGCGDMNDLAVNTNLSSYTTWFEENGHCKVAEGGGMCVPV